MHYVFTYDQIFRLVFQLCALHFLFRFCCCLGCLLFGKADGMTQQKQEVPNTELKSEAKKQAFAKKISNYNLPNNISI